MGRKSLTFFVLVSNPTEPRRREILKEHTGISSPAYVFEAFNRRETNDERIFRGIFRFNIQAPERMDRFVFDYRQ